jgi:hypothetical protein
MNGKRTPMKLKSTLFFGLLFSLSSVAVGQCNSQDMDFMGLFNQQTSCKYFYIKNTNTGNWVGGAGDHRANRHTRLVRPTTRDTNPTDPNTGGGLTIFPSGENVSIKLGNDQVTGSKNPAFAERIEYRLRVHKDNALLLLRFAVVFQDPGHKPVEQPRFVVKILKSGTGDTLVEPCAEYDVTSAAGIPGFQSYTPKGGTAVRWRDWTTISLDLSAYINQEIRVQFTTYDCTLGAHYGYAYFWAKCVRNILDMTVCAEDTDSLVLKAPDYCSSYLWSNSDTTQSAVFRLGTPDATPPFSASCLITSFTGCQYTLNARIIPNTGDAIEENSIYDTVHQGQSYNKHDFVLPPQLRIGTFTHINSFYQVDPCNFEYKTVTLFLTVLPNITHIEDIICFEDTYDTNGFFIPPEKYGTDKIYYETLTIARMVGQDIVDSVVNLTLRINDNPNLPDTIIGEQNPCSGGGLETEMPSFKAIKFDGSDVSDSITFRWIVPVIFDTISKVPLIIDTVRVVHIVDGQYTPSVRLQFTNDAKPIDTLKLHVANGCRDTMLRLPIYLQLSYHDDLIFDTICVGESYEKHGFSIPVQDTAGFKIFEENFGWKSQSGCDSVVALHLYILPALDSTELAIKASSDTICEKDLVKLEVATKGRWVLDVDTNDGSIYYWLDETGVFDPALDYLALEYQWSTGYTGREFWAKPAKDSMFSVAVSYSNNRCSVDRNKHITVFHSTHGFLVLDVCDQVSYNGISYDINTRLIDTLQSVVTGCDSLLYVSINVLGPDRDTVSYEGCDRVHYRDSLYTSTTNRTDNLSPNSGGGVCSTIRTAFLKVHYSDWDSIHRHDIDSVVYSGTSYYRDTVLFFPHKTVVGGCDSIFEVHISVCQTTFGKEDFEGCEFYNYKGTIHRKDTVFIDPLTNVAGCDSLLTVTIKILRNTYDHRIIDTCNEITFKGQLYNTDTMLVVMDTLPELNQYGCLSIMHVNINVMKLQTRTVELVDCDSVYYRGKFHLSDVTIRDTFDFENCDTEMERIAIIKVNKSIYRIVDTTVEGKILIQDSIYRRSTTVTTYHTSVNTGCDSIIEYRVVVTPDVYPEIVVYWHRVLAVPNRDNSDELRYPNATYRWYRDGILMDHSDRDWIEIFGAPPIPKGTYNVSVRDRNNREIYYLQRIFDHDFGIAPVLAFPNPVRMEEELAVRANLKINRIEVYDIKGVRQYFVSIREIIDGRAIHGFRAQGLYLLRVYLEDQTVETVKILVK